MKIERGFSVTFSQFAKTLYPYFQEKYTEAEFTVELVTQIMHGQPGRAHSDGTYQNPLLHKDERNWNYFFSGTRKIPRKDSSRILSSIDKYKFEQYLRRCCSEGALNRIKKDLSEIETIPKGDGAEVCADLFEQILHDLAKE